MKNLTRKKSDFLEKKRFPGVGGHVWNSKKVIGTVFEKKFTFLTFSWSLSHFLTPTLNLTLTLTGLLTLTLTLTLTLRPPQSSTFVPRTPDAGPRTPASGDTKKLVSPDAGVRGANVTGRESTCSPQNAQNDQKCQKCPKMPKMSKNNQK